MNTKCSCFNFSFFSWYLSFFLILFCPTYENKKKKQKSKANLFICVFWINSKIEQILFFYPKKFCFLYRDRKIKDKKFKDRGEVKIFWIKFREMRKFFYLFFFLFILHSTLSPLLFCILLFCILLFLNFENGQISIFI